MRSAYNHEYAVYQGDTFVAIGTMKELADFFGTTVGAVSYWKTAANRKKIRGDNSTRRIMIQIDYQEEDENEVERLFKIRRNIRDSACISRREGFGL